MRLYEADPYRHRTFAKVFEIKEDKGTWMRFDQTIFYPQGGGQPADTGWLQSEDKSIRIVDVQEEGEEVWHKIQGQTPSLESTFEMIIDWERRFHFMQSHTGEHLISGIIYKQFGYHNVGFHMNEDLITCDFDGQFTEENLEDLVRLVNAAIQTNTPVVCSYPGPEAVKNMTYRAKKAIDGDIRITEIQGYDTCACCGLHVAHTGEIGMAFLKEAMNYKGGTRLTFQFGMKAVESLLQQTAALKHVTYALSCNVETLVERFDLYQESQEELKDENRLLSEALLDMVVEGIDESEEPLFIYRESFSLKDLERLSKKLEDKRRTICLSGSSNNGGLCFLISDQDERARIFLDRLKEDFAIKGGGNRKSVRGQIAAQAQDLEVIWKQIVQ